MRVALFALILCTCGAALVAQTRAEPPTTSKPASPVAPATKPDEPAPIYFRDEPLTIESIGLTMLVPEGCDVDAQSMAGNTAATFQDEKGRWLIKVQTPRSARKDLTLTKVVDEALTQLLDAHRIPEIRRDKVDVNTGVANVLDRQPGSGQALTIANEGRALPIERFYVEMPPTLMVDQDPVVRGFTAAKIGSDQFITFELFTTKTHYSLARKVYELTIGGARFADMSKAREARATLIGAGLKFFEQLTRDDIQAAMNAQPERWERLYRAGPTGKKDDDVEVGYRRIRFETGREAGAAREGWIARIEARFLQEGSIVDTESVFHMTYDRKEENWTVRMSIRDAKNKEGKPVTHTETGARIDRQMTVRVESPAVAPKVINPQIVGDGYISRVESFILPQLLVRKQMPLQYGFYAYQSQTERITLRRDSLERPTNEGGAWKLTSRLAEGTPETTSTYAANGTLIHGDMGSGIESELSTVKDLLDLWKKKGLPI